MIHPDVIRGALRAVLSNGLRRIAETSQTAHAFAQAPSRVTRLVLARHLAEHALRIRAFRPLDALALEQVSEADSSAADLWGRYARSEAVHDRYFLRDLAAMGVDRARVAASPPFPSTLELVDFVHRAARRYGPVAVVLYSFFAEENSDVGSAAIIRRAGRLFGA